MPCRFADSYTHPWDYIRSIRVDMYTVCRNRPLCFKDRPVSRLGELHEKCLFLNQSSHWKTGVIHAFQMAYSLKLLVARNRV